MRGQTPAELSRLTDPPFSPQSLLFPVAFGFGCESLVLLEEQGIGAQWYNLGTAPAEGVFSLAQVSAFLVLDAAIYGLALWYLEAVCPGGPQGKGSWWGTLHTGSQAGVCRTEGKMF